jgi:hypothetical protein
MTGGRMPWSSEDITRPDMRADEESIDRAHRVLEIARASGHVYKVTVPDAAGEFTLFYLRTGQSVTVLGELDTVTNEVTNVRLVNSALFLAFLDNGNWRVIPVRDHDTPHH